jgi:cytochrome c2
MRITKSILLVCLCLAVTVVGCSRQPTTLAEFVTSDKSPQETAEFVFANNKCNDCHTLGKEGKFGFTSWGAQLRQQSEGCVALLTAMNVMTNVPEQQRTSDEQRKFAHFQDYGCAVCHKVTPGKMGLTETGTKLASLHLSCPEVQSILTQGNDVK